MFCCTGATGPVIRRAWLAPGPHLSSVGASHGPEAEADSARDALPFAERPGAAASPPPAGPSACSGPSCPATTAAPAPAPG